MKNAKNAAAAEGEKDNPDICTTAPLPPVVIDLLASEEIPAFRQKDDMLSKITKLST